MLTKPPPKPPTFIRHAAPLATKPSVVTGFKQLTHYQLPMAGERPAWLAILERCGYPIDAVVIDFETYFDADYKMARGGGDGLSTVEYVADSRFEELGCAFTRVQARDGAFADYEAATFFQVGEEMVKTQLECYQKLYGQNLERCTVVIQNAPFDALILLRRHGIEPPYLVDVLSLARHWHSRQKNGLDALTKQYKLPEKGDTEEFKGLTFRRRYTKSKSRKKGPKMPVQVPVATPEQTGRLSGYACNDAMREWEMFTLLLPKLSNPEIELRLMRHTLGLWLRPSLKVDFDKGRELVTLMNAEIDAAMSRVGVTDRKEISGDNSFEWLLKTALEACGDSLSPYIKVGKDKMLLAIAKTDAERKLLENHADETVRNLMAARIALDSWPIHIKRVERIMRMASCCDGYLPVPLKYHGAHTGRWSGGEKINLQNLGSRGHDLISAVRQMIVALLGKVLVIVDASQIEARVLAWIAGQWDLVERFANNEEIYCGFASSVLGYTVRKPKKSGGIPAIEKRMLWARNSIGKVGVLGCGYGMGTDRIHEYAGGAIDLETADKIKVVYRRDNPAICQFWRDIEKAFVYTAKYRKPCQMPRGLRFDSTEDCDVIITLPNGRELKYHRVKLVPNDRGDTIEVWNGTEHHWEHVWGGHLTENVVQAMSRDILAECFLRLEDQGWHTTFHCHDEVLLCVDEADGEQVLKLAITEMARRPAWGPELPLGAEGLLSKCYKK